MTACASRESEWATIPPPDSFARYIAESAARRSPSASIAWSGAMATPTLAPTWIQTCCFAIDGQEINEAERSAYLALIESLKDKIKGVHLYGLARPSMQPDAGRLSNLPPEHFRHLAESISALGIEVVANP